MKRILIADDHSLVRYGLRLALSNHFSDTEIDEGWDGNSVMERLQANPYDLILLDLTMPDTDSSVLLHWIRNSYPDTKVLVVSMNSENLFGKRSLQLGADGYLEKDSPPDDLIKAVNMIMAGKKYVSANLSDILIQETLNGRSVNPFDALTPREFQVAMYMVQDYSLTQIGEMLQVQYTSVNTFKRRIFEKLDVEDRKGLVQLAEAYGLH